MNQEHKQFFESWSEKLASRGTDLGQIKAQLKSFKVETPSWGYGDAGTRFKVFHQKGAARNIWEKLKDAAQVHKYTGCAPSVAVHIPWDKVSDYKALQEYAGNLGLRIGAVNPNLFQDEIYKLGSVTNPSASVRKQAVQHLLECVEIAQEVGSSLLSLWFADGTNYPGQDDFRRRKRFMFDALQEVYGKLPAGMRMLIEYKFFEPAFYHTDIADWGMAYLMASKLGPQAQVLVDLGHHAPGVNVEQIVATLIDEGKLGGFHFNNRKYADDDLIVGSINPYELFLIFAEIVRGTKDPAAVSTVSQVAYMIDQSHNVERKIPAMIMSVMNVQTAYARALLIDEAALAEAQSEGDIIRAQRVLQAAFETDVRPLLAVVRQEMGIPVDPLEAYLASGYEREIEERG